MNKIYINGSEMVYYRDPAYNNPSSNERTIEIPILKWYIDNHPTDLIEIGAVSCYYYDTTHPIYDPSDSHPKSIHTKAEDIDFVDKNVLSVSTIEHIGHGDYGLEVNNNAMVVLERIISDSKTHLITLPIGFNKVLDSYIKQNIKNYHVLKRINHNNEWVVDDSRSMDYTYNSPFTCGNALCLISNVLGGI